MTTKALPRSTIREDKFRLYEKHLAKALVSDQIIDPAPLKPASWIVAFKEARLGFIRYGYQSTLIKPDSNLMSIFAHETTDGKVFLTRERRPNPHSKPSERVDPESKTQGCDWSQRELVGQIVQQGKADPDWLMQNVVIIRCATDSELGEAFMELKKELPFSSQDKVKREILLG